MIPRVIDAGSRGERQLARLYRALEAEDRGSLLAFAEFLASRATARDSEAEPPGPRKPDPIPRPREESVVAAIKRLSRSYYMLDRSLMLNDTSSLMGSHVLQGRSAREVIDDLEALFARYYDKYREQEEQDTR